MRGTVEKRLRKLATEMATFTGRPEDKAYKILKKAYKKKES